MLNRNQKKDDDDDSGITYYYEKEWATKRMKRRTNGKRENWRRNKSKAFRRLKNVFK